jgi:hypothetical protein
MPKAKVERIISDDGTTKTVEVEVGERGTVKPARYAIPSNAQRWQEVVLSLSDKTDGGQYAKSLFGEDQKDSGESPLALAYRLFVSAVDKYARAAVYESIAQESTIITVGKEKVDILTFPIQRLVKAINGMRSQVDIRAMAGGDSEDARAAAERSVGYGPWRTAARKLLEGGYTFEKDGQTVRVDKPQAVENPSSGMLELLPA